MEICAKHDESDGDRAVACLCYGTLKGVHMCLECML
jgi:hypothetical protein